MPLGGPENDGSIDRFRGHACLGVHTPRLQQLPPFLRTTSVSNKSRICFSLKDNPNGFKTLDSGTVWHSKTRVALSGRGSLERRRFAKSYSHPFIFLSSLRR